MVQKEGKQKMENGRKTFNGWELEKKFGHLEWKIIKLERIIDQLDIKKLSKLRENCVTC